MAKKLEKFETFKEDPTVEVVENRFSRSRDGLTMIPQPIVEHFKAKGAHVNLIYFSPQNLAQEGVYDRFPVYIHELPKEIQDLCRTVFEDPDRHGGMLRRADTVVAWQSLEARDYWRGEAAKQNEAQDDYWQNQEYERLQNVARSSGAGKKGFVEIRPENVGRVRDHVFGGKELAAQMAAAQAAAEE